VHLADILQQVYFAGGHTGYIEFIGHDGKGVRTYNKVTEIFCEENKANKAKVFIAFYRRR